MARGGEIIFYLGSKIPHGHPYVGDTCAGEALDVIVYYWASVDFKKRLWGGKSERTQTFPLSSGHQNGCQREECVGAVEVDKAVDCSVRPQFRQQGYPFFPGLPKGVYPF